MPDFRSPQFLLDHIQHTLRFYEGRNLDPSGGFFHFFKDDGRVFDAHTRHLVSSTRFVFNHAMAFRRFGRAQDQAAAHHGLRFLHAAHEQPQGGFAWQIDWRKGRATVQDGTHHCYGLAFVLLAHAHALMASVSEAAEGLEATWQLMNARFWETDAQLYADEATPDWTVGPYRGQNANMHGCEAMMAAFEATQDHKYLDRALTLARSVTQRLATLAGSLVWEHYRRTPDGWAVDWDYNRDDKTNIFRPWGFQTGHLTEWAKLLMQLERHLPAGHGEDWMLPTARHFFDTAMRHGWDDTHGGLVYGFAQAEGGPVGCFEVCDADKYFWVQAESFAAAALLAVRTGDAAYWRWYDRIWDYAWAHFVDHTHGAWYRILGPDNRKLSDDKSPAGKTDYHTMGACYDVLRGLGA